MKIFIAFVFILTSLSVFADDDCSLNSTDVEKQKLFNRFQSLKVYGKMYRNQIFFFENLSFRDEFRFSVSKRKVNRAFIALAFVNHFLRLTERQRRNNKMERHLFSVNWTLQNLSEEVRRRKNRIDSTFEQFNWEENRSSFFTDNWMLLTYENGERFINVCDNQTRSAAFVFVCGSNTVRREMWKINNGNERD